MEVRKDQDPDLYTLSPPAPKLLASLAALISAEILKDCASLMPAI